MRAPARTMCVIFVRRNIDFFFACVCFSVGRKRERARGCCVCLSSCHSISICNKICWYSRRCLKLDIKCTECFIWWVIKRTVWSLICCMSFLFSLSCQVKNIVFYAIRQRRRRHTHSIRNWHCENASARSRNRLICKFFCIYTWNVWRL